MKSLEDVCVEICERVAKKLVSLSTEDGGATTNPTASRLIFPNYRNVTKGDIQTRVSEQESRVLFCQEVEALMESETRKDYPELYYSIETPTINKYSFSNDPKIINIEKLGGQSAMSDLSLFDKGHDDKLKRVVNVEFKAHNVATKNIVKDLLKLVAEPCHGVFFHTLKNVDSGTLCSILDKYSGIMKYQEDISLSLIDQTKSILFYLCILEKKTALYKVLHFPKPNEWDSTQGFFKVDYEKIKGLFKNKPFEPTIVDGWQIVSLDPLTND